MYRIEVDPNVEPELFLNNLATFEEVTVIERAPYYYSVVNDQYANQSFMSYLSTIEADKAWAA